MKNLNFYGLDSSNNRQLRMSIDTSGNVGLGITDPTTRLEIVGDLSLNGSIYHNGILFTPSENTSTNIDQTTDISLNNLKVHGDLSANDASFNVIDVSAIFIQGRDLIGEDVPTALDTLKELADALDNSANFAANVTTTLAAIQSDISTKQATITTNDLSLGDISGLYTQLNSKQNTIADGDLTIAKTSGLQTALDSKQATITTNDLSLGDISGLYIQLNSKQNTIADGDLTIAKTSGLQSALDAKQATISTNDLSLGDISGLYTQLDSKQDNIADGDLTIAKTSGLQTALDSKQATITTNDLSLGDVSGLYTQLNSKQNTIADGDLTIAKTNGLQSELDAKQVTVTETVDVSLNNLKVHGDLSANDASFNVLEAIQVLINGEDLSGAIYTKINTDIDNAISNLVDNAPIALDTLKELADALDNSANFASNVTVRLNAIETDVAGKQNTIADGDLTIAKTSGLQSALDAKQATITTNDLSLGDVNGLYTQLSSKQDNIADGDLTIAKTNGLQAALDAKQATITTNDLSLGDISGLYTQLASKQDTIADGDLTIAKTSGLQSALDAKQATITTNDLSLGDVSGLYTQLASKQPTIADGDLTIAKTSGLQSALDAKQATISDGDLTIAKTSGLQSTLDAKQATISDGDLTIAKTSGLQAALDAKQATIADGDLTIAKTNGLQAALDAKQATIADGDLTIAKTNGLQAALDAKQAIITESVDVSLNNLKLHGDLSANDASFNVVDISSINTSSTSFMNSIIPNANDTYSLGDISNVWKDIYIGPGSLYIDGQKVIESDSSTIVVAADTNQNMKINTTGSGVLQLESAQGLEITSTGSGNITIGSTSTGTVRITDNIILSSGVEIQNETDTTVKINDGLNVTGAYLQNGTNINTIYAPLSSPTLTGTPLAPTASSGTNTTQIATTAFVTTAVDNLIGGAPGALDTLNELAQALDNSGSFASNITTKVGSIETQLATKQDTIYTNDLSLGDISGLYTQLATIPTNNNQLTNGSSYITASSTDTLTNKSISYSQLTGAPTIPTNNNQLTNGEGFITASSTDTFTNKTMSYSQLTGTPTIPTNNNQLTNGSSYITASSTDTFTNKTMSYSQLTGTPTIPTNNNQLTNGASYITASSTDTLTNKSISYSQLTGAPTIPTNNNQLTNGSSYITASSTDTLTNKSMSYSQLTGTPTIPTNNNQLTNGSGYITASSTNTLTNKTMSISQITNLQTEIDSKQATLTAGTNITITGSTISASGGGGNADTVTNGVYTTGAQTVGGAKTFSSAVTVGNYTLPTTAGTSGQVLKYPGAGSTLEWGSCGGSSTTVTKNGQILEELVHICDGGTVKGVSTDYTWPTVTAVQPTTLTYTTLSGSEITYTPPDGATEVVYILSIAASTTAQSGVYHIRMMIDGVESGASPTIGGAESRQYGTLETIRFVLDAWSGSKTLKLEVRHHSSNTFLMNIHKRTLTPTGSTTTSNELIKPILNIRTIGILTTTSHGIDSTTDVSMNNLWVAGDLSGNSCDATFNTITTGSIVINGDISANDASFNVIDVNTILIQGRDLVGPGVSDAMDTLKELADALDSSANFSANVTTRLNTIETDIAGKQATIADGDLTIAKTNGLQTALDGKQSTISTNDLSLGDISGLYTQLASKQPTIADGDLTIAKTSGLQSALDAKQATLTAGTNITITGSTISASGSGGGSSVWSGSSDIYYTGGDVGIGTTSPQTALQIGAEGPEGPNDGIGSWGTYNIEAGSLSIINENASSGTDTKTVIDMARYGKSSYAYGARCQIKIGRYDSASSGAPYDAKTRIDFDLLDQSSSSSLNNVMTLQANGRVGIGTTSPYAPLYIEISQPASSETLQTSGQTTFNNTVVAGFTTTNSLPNNYGLIVGLLNNGTSYLQALSRTHSSYYNLLLNPNGGNVGIGMTSPTALLHINSSLTHSSSNFTSGYYIRSAGNGGGASSSGYDYNSTWSAYPLSILAEGGVYAKTGYIVASDRRIKENIVDVPDDLALRMVRDIPCRYYEYKDKINRSEKKTIGFIAQEVKEILPMAVSIQTDIIPNEMRNLTDINWNDNRLYTDLSDCSGIKYRFYVSNDLSGNDEVMKEVVGNSDNTFTFDTSYNNVFCYGKEVNDFHTLDKQKLFALNFSATQEIDRIQQQHIIDISNAQATIQQHETTIQQHETTIQQQQLEIENLKLVNQDMNNQINMIKEHLGL